MNQKFDALLIASFGGPESMGDVMPFLDNVLRGKNVPDARKKEVAHHYEIFGGVSPINAQNRELKSLLEKKLKEQNIDLPVFWGNRNWNPYFKDALLEMKQKGVKKALAYITSAYGSYSGCRQYLENIKNARAEIPDAPEVQRLPLFFDHPNFIQVNVEHIQNQIDQISGKDFHVAFTAHSIPASMSQTSPYLSQLQQVCSFVAQKLNLRNWKLVFQSRSGPPTMPWLEPDICDHLEELAKQNVRNVIVSPIGFVSDHMEVIYDLDVEAKKKSNELGISMYRASSAGNHSLMIEMIVDQIRKQLAGEAPFVCKPDCCKINR